MKGCEVVVRFIFLKEVSGGLMGEYLRRSISQPVAGETFWERHVKINRYNLPCIVCQEFGQLKRSRKGESKQKDLALLPLTEASFVNKASTGIKAKADDINTIFLICGKSIAAFRTASVA